MRQRTLICMPFYFKMMVLICGTLPLRGFPGQWALSGGGVESGEPIKRHYAAKFAKNWENSCF